MNYAQAIRFLSGFGKFGMRPGLETARKLATLAGDPHRKLRFIHVAGTNGKGSTCAFLESIYRAAGYRTGLYTSPHLVSFRERIQVNRQLIPETEVAALVAELQVHAEAMAAGPNGVQPTFFELVTVLALRWFAAQQCDVVIWETGLGGRLDATNIVTPLASVITNIGWDHMQWLGDTLPKIAAEKAGIIKPGVPALKADDPADVLDVFRTVAAGCKAPLRIVRWQDTEKPPLHQVALPLLGKHQQLNAALALATVETLQGQLPVTPAAIETGLLNTRWTGRFQVERTADGRTLVLDGAHNPDGVQVLRDALERQFAGRRPALIIGLLADKDWSAMARTLAPVVSSVCAVKVGAERALDPAALAAEFRRVEPALPVTTAGSLEDALRGSAAEPFVLVAGSLYLIGEALECLGLAPAAGERTLNDYRANAR